MKLLLISDEESPYLWDYYRPGMLDDIDLILSCGDLKPEYLSFLVTMGRAPLLYVHGNHDGRYAHHPPEGCDCIEDKLVTIGGLRILGLGGAPLYSGGPHQYSERQMRFRIWKLRRALKKHGGADIILTHAPVRGFGDADDFAHRGFEAFLPLLERWQPRYLIHGHVHGRYGQNIPRSISCGATTILNAMGRCYLEIEPPQQ